MNSQFWIALLTPIITGIILGVGRALNKKLITVTERLDNQDKSKLEFELAMSSRDQQMGERLSRLEGPVRAAISHNE